MRVHDRTRFLVVALAGLSIGGCANSPDELALPDIAIIDPATTIAACLNAPTGPTNFERTP